MSNSEEALLSRFLPTFMQKFLSILFEERIGIEQERERTEESEERWTVPCLFHVFLCIFYLVEGYNLQCDFNFKPFVKTRINQWVKKFDISRRSTILVHRKENHK